MKQAARKWLLFSVRWGIAIAGIWWVVSNLSVRDHLVVLDARNRPAGATLAVPAKEESRQFQVLVDPATGQPGTVARSRTINPVGGKRPVVLSIVTADGPKHMQLLGLDLSDDLKRVRRLLVAEGEGEGQWIRPSRVVGGFTPSVAYPRVDVGLATMVRTARPGLLWAAVLIFPIVYVITTLRWRWLLEILDIHLTRRRTFVLNMVGAFYNSFMPGQTGGDVLKAYYASRHTTHKARAVLSVLVDRVIGLLALVILGGVMATVYYVTAPDRSVPAAVASRNVALGAAVILGGTLVGLVVLGSKTLRRGLGLSYLLYRLPMQRHVQKVTEAMRLYRYAPGALFASLIATLPVHITIVISAMLAGMAFGLPLPPAYYFVAVPVIVLAGSMPISPQGAGVMEFFAILLTQQYGTKIGQAFALTMSIRVVQIAWNLTGGIFVFRGGYHAPSQKEADELEAAEDDLKEEAPDDGSHESPAAAPTTP